MIDAYPVRFSVDYPDRPLDRTSSFLRIFTALPILILLGTLAGAGAHPEENGRAPTVRIVVESSGLVFVPVLLMLLFRRKYPLWWFLWNRELLRFMNRVYVYLALMDDRYPSTDEAQSVHLDFEYPDAARDLSRWMPLVKWILVLPHLILLAILGIAVLVGVVLAWFAILFTERYPRSLFNLVEGYLRWGNRVACYSVLLVTDRYPPFGLQG